MDSNGTRLRQAGTDKGSAKPAERIVDTLNLGQYGVTHRVEDGQRWWNLREMLQHLGYTLDYNPPHVEGAHKRFFAVETNRGQQPYLYLSDAGIIRFLERLHKKKARSFRNQIAAAQVVVPQGGSDPIPQAPSRPVPQETAAPSVPRTAASAKVLDPVDFHGQRLTLVDREGEPYVAMRYVVEGMGLDWKAQHAKLTSDNSRFCVAMIRMQPWGDSQVREVTCIPLRKLAGWLFTLQPSRINLFVADKVRRYQDECDGVLQSAWSRYVAKQTPASNDAATTLKSLSFEDHPVRIQMIDGEPWWVAKDVAEMLGYIWNGSSRIEHVPEKWRGVTSVVTPSGNQQMALLSEQGLYWFLARSDKPRALPFQEWIAGEVLPSIRRTGRYSAFPEDPTRMGLPDFTDPIAAAEGWLAEAKGRRKAEIEARAAKERAHILAAKLAEDAPLVDFAERVEASPTTHLVGAVAKMIQQGTGMPMGQNRLFEWLRENRYLHQTGSRTNQPTQRSLDQGWFVLQVRNVEIRDESRVKYTTRVTGKGLLHFYEHFYRTAIELGLKPRVRPELVTSAEVLRQLPLWADEDSDQVDEDLLKEAKRRAPKP